MRPLNEYVTADKPEQLPVALHEGQLYCAGHFSAAVARWAQRLQAEPQRRYALFTHDAYPFAVMLFGLLHAGKEAWIPGNNLPGTAHRLQAAHCRLLGDWPGVDVADAHAWPAEASAAGTVQPLAEDAPAIVLFTSGSSGQAQAVPKTLRQLQAEILALETLWGAALAHAEAVATVSHQHIYGLLFRVLWPLAAGRCFHSHTYLSPESLLAHCTTGGARYWVASPGHLKRLDEDSPWQQLAQLALIFSSGGPLPAVAAERIATRVGALIEVYGSTETGGIAWRQASGNPDAPWQTFTDVVLTRNAGDLYIASPYLPAPNAVRVDDRLTLLEDGRLLLHGRRDRIVKIEDKRLSLTALEHCLTALAWVTEAYAFALPGRRDVVAVALVLSAAGKAILDGQGRNALLKCLRGELAEHFDAVVLPRKWLFVAHLPLTAQGKVNRDLLATLLTTDPHVLPRVSAADIGVAIVELTLKVPKELDCFPNHFPGFALLPGVVQIGWAEYFGKLFFAIMPPFSHMEAIKFGKMIHPQDQLTLRLEWRAAPGKLSFRYASNDRVYGAGRLVYEDKS